MLRPTKYTDPDTCVLWCASIVIESLKDSKVSRRSVPYLEAVLVKRVGDVGYQTLIYALGFLYMIGVVEYNDSRDEIILCKRK